ncbi:MAG: hypothetical protein H0A76_00070 [Candidatus Thiodubiliella endoseptemdiera]|uniref:Uncharacterized protein n=1 Tax=Candidatus Thiodubiliella endoseptemdiera TaxID=2738886 RepID=A0A853F3N8_9GAMM|nr:hypothetical protein [Candidatus Thiodubiliella endoseptemdiera]
MLGVYKDIHTQDDLADLSASLVKMTIEVALGAEMEHHLIPKAQAR